MNHLGNCLGEQKKLNFDENVALHALSKFTNPVCLVQSETDEWILEQTIINYKNALAKNNNYKFILLKNADHPLKQGNSNERFKQILAEWFANKRNV